MALKNTPSSSSIKTDNKITTEEVFDIPFMDCEAPLENKTIRQCFFDIKQILEYNSIALKPVSEFGKVLCGKYKTRKLFIKHPSQHIYSKFNFGTPSPDDIVSKHLRR